MTEIVAMRTREVSGQLNVIQIGRMDSLGSPLWEVATHCPLTLPLFSGGSPLNVEVYTPKVSISV